MIVTLHTDKFSTLEQLRAFADGTQARSFQASSRQEAYDLYGCLHLCKST
jgi:hypothetical protein